MSYFCSLFVLNTFKYRLLLFDHFLSHPYMPSFRFIAMLHIFCLNKLFFSHIYRNKYYNFYDSVSHHSINCFGNSYFNLSLYFSYKQMNKNSFAYKKRIYSHHQIFYFSDNYFILVDAQIICPYIIFLFSFMYHLL